MHFSKVLIILTIYIFLRKIICGKKWFLQNVIFIPSCIQLYLTSNLGNKKLKGDFNPMHVRDIACEQ